MNNEKLPKAALNKPNIKGAEVIATERGWEAVYAGRDSNELLVEHKGLKSAIAGYAGYLTELIDDVIDDATDLLDGAIDDAKELVDETIGELTDKVDKIEDIVTEAVEDIVDVVTGEEKQEPSAYTRESLTALEYPLLVELAKENEVEGRSRVDLVNGLCKTFGLV